MFKAIKMADLIAIYIFLLKVEKYFTHLLTFLVIFISFMIMATTLNITLIHISLHVIYSFQCPLPMTVVLQLYMIFEVA